MKNTLLKIILILTISVLLFTSCSNTADAPDESQSSSLSASSSEQTSSNGTSEAEPTDSDAESTPSGDNTDAPAEGDTKPAPQGNNPVNNKPADGNNNNNNPSPQKPVDNTPLPPKKTPVVKAPVSGSAQESSSLSGDSVIDYSNITKGYVMLKNSGAGGALRGVVATPNGKTYQYPFESNGQWVVCPLTEGNGTYTVQIAENISGSQFRQIAAREINVSLEDANLPFLYPSMRVNFNAGSKCVDLAAELVRGKDTDIQKIEAIFEYIVTNIDYDDAKAANPPAGYIPNPDRTINEKKGICGDYSVLAAAMLRSQGIPIKLIEGNVSPGVRHAWNMASPKGSGNVSARINFNGSWTLVDFTFERAVRKGGNTNPNVGSGNGYAPDKTY